MFSRLIFVPLVGIITVIGGAVYYFNFSNQQSPTTNFQESEDGTKIASQFIDSELKEFGTSRGFNYQQTQAGIKAGLSVHDANFANGLEEGFKTAEGFLYHGDIIKLKREYYLFFANTIKEAQELLTKQDLEIELQESMKQSIKSFQDELNNSLVFPANLGDQKPDEVTPQALPTRPRSSFSTNHDLTEEELRGAFYQIEADYKVAHPLPVVQPSIFSFNNSNQPLQFPYCAVPLNIVSETINGANGDLAAESHLDEIIKYCRTTRHQLVFIPINGDFNGSVLVYYTKSKQFYHYDLMGLNQTRLQKFHEKLTKALGVNNHLNSPVISTQGKNYESGLAAVGVVRCLVNKLPLSSLDLSAEREYWKKKGVAKQ